MQNRRGHWSLCSSDVACFTVRSPAIERTPCVLQIVSLHSVSWFISYTTGFHFKLNTVCARVCPRVPAYTHAVNVALSHRTRGSYDSITLAGFCTRLL